MQSILFEDEDALEKIGELGVKWLIQNLQK